MNRFPIAFAAALLAPSGASAGHSPLPSFLMILADDIGWADFSWNNGTANTPRMAEVRLNH